MTAELTYFILVLWLVSGLVGGLLMLDRFRQNWFERFNVTRPTTDTDYVCVGLMCLTGPVGLVFGIAFHHYVRNDY